MISFTPYLWRHRSLCKMTSSKRHSFNIFFSSFYIWCRRLFFHLFEIIPNFWRTRDVFWCRHICLRMIISTAFAHLDLMTSSSTFFSLFIFFSFLFIIFFVFVLFFIRILLLLLLLLFLFLDGNLILRYFFQQTSRRPKNSRQIWSFKKNWKLLAVIICKIFDQR